VNWKPNSDRVELQMERQHLGKLKVYAAIHDLPAQAALCLAEETEERSDFLRLPGPSVDWSLHPEEQPTEMAALLSAAQTLAEIGRQIGDQSEVTDPGNS
jgi:hypothetical protein